MKVLKEVNVNNWSCIKVCFHCFSELEINANDIELNSLYYELYYTCPVCKQRNLIEDSETPHNLPIKSNLK